MNVLILNRIYSEANFMIETDSTIRQISKAFNVSKSTVHKDLHERLFDVDNMLFEKVSLILKHHKETRHIRGGQSTKKKYKKGN